MICFWGEYPSNYCQNSVTMLGTAHHGDWNSPFLRSSIPFRWYIPGTCQSCNLSTEVSLFHVINRGKAFLAVLILLLFAWDSPFKNMSFLEFWPASKELFICVQLSVFFKKSIRQKVYEKSTYLFHVPILASKHKKKSLYFSFAAQATKAFSLFSQRKFSLLHARKERGDKWQRSENGRREKKKPRRRRRKEMGMGENNKIICRRFLPHTAE